LKVKVVIPVFGVNPEPLTVTEVLAGPVEGVSEIDGVVMVNVAEAVSGPPSLPVATAGYAPVASEGTLKVQLNVPVPEVVLVVHVCVPGVAPPNVKVVMAVFGVNPEPETLTTIPLGP
jgi:hypothetical protein